MVSRIACVVTGGSPGFAIARWIAATRSKSRMALSDIDAVGAQRRGVGDAFAKLRDRHAAFLDLAHDGAAVDQFAPVLVDRLRIAQAGEALEFFGEIGAFLKRRDDVAGALVLQRPAVQAACSAAMRLVSSRFKKVAIAISRQNTSRIMISAMVRPSTRPRWYDERCSHNLSAHGRTRLSGFIGRDLSEPGSPAERGASAAWISCNSWLTATTTLWACSRLISVFLA